MPFNVLLCDSSAMADGESLLYTLLLSIKPDNLSINAWASRAGVNRSWFYDVKGGANPRTEMLDRVVEAAGYTPAQFHDLRRNVQNKPGAEPAPASRGLPFRRRHEPMDIPHLGTAQGSDMEVQVDGTILFVERMDLDEANVVDHIRRPESLIGQDDVYAITVIGDSVAPRYDDGDPAYISAKQKPRHGDYVVVQLKKQGDDGEERLHIALLKKLVRRTSTYIELCQHNPEVQFTIPLTQVHAVHRVIPWKEIVFF